MSTGKHLYWSLLSITLQAFSHAALLKRLQHSCFPVNIAKFLGTVSFIEHLRFYTLNNYTLNLNRAFGNLHIMSNFNFLVIQWSDALWKAPTSQCCFRKVVSNDFFQQVLLINIISTYVNLLQHFSFARFLLIERRLWEVCTTKGDGYWLQS